MYKKMELFHSDHLIAYHIDSKISIILYTYLSIPLSIYQAFENFDAYQNKSHITL